MINFASAGSNGKPDVRVTGKPTRKPRAISKKNFQRNSGYCQRVFAFDEGRFGLKIRLRRRWCPLGKRPPCPVEDQYEWVWVYVAVEPVQGECFCLLLPRTDGICLECFLNELKAVTGEATVGLVLDNAPSHTSTQVQWPEGFQPIPLPSYSPELNPAEQVFRHLRDRLSNRVFDSIQALEDALCQAILDFQADHDKVRSLTAYPWWRQALQQDDIPSFAA